MIEQKYGNYLRIMQWSIDDKKKKHAQYFDDDDYEVESIDIRMQLLNFVDKESKWDVSEHAVYLSFLKFEEGRIRADDEKVKQFGYSLTRILKYINEEIYSKKSTNNVPESAPLENDFSDSKPLERMIILEKLGIIKYIQSLQNDKDNEKHTAEILSSFTGIVSGTIAKNLGVMGLKENNKDKNSPYKNPKNLNLANNKLDKFNIDLTKIIK